MYLIIFYVIIFLFSLHAVLPYLTHPCYHNIFFSSYTSFTLVLRLYNYLAINYLARQISSSIISHGFLKCIKLLGYRGQLYDNYCPRVHLVLTINIYSKYSDSKIIISEYHITKLNKNKISVKYSVCKCKNIAA